MIDVLRAFTTAAMGFHQGAEAIVLADTVARARALKAALPGALLVGEVEARPVPGFDFHNSPSRLRGVDLAGRTLILRTTCGTQGVIRSRRARRILCASFANVTATARDLAADHGPWWSVVSGRRAHDTAHEDAACSDALCLLAAGQEAPWETLFGRVRRARHAQRFVEADGSAFPAADLEWACRHDWLDAVMEVRGRRIEGFGEVPILTARSKLGPGAGERRGAEGFESARG